MGLPEVGQGLSWNSQLERLIWAGPQMGLPHRWARGLTSEPMKDCINMLLSLIFNIQFLVLSFILLVFWDFRGSSSPVAMILRMFLCPRVCVYKCLNVSVCASAWMFCKTEAFIGWCSRHDTHITFCPGHQYCWFYVPDTITGQRQPESKENLSQIASSYGSSDFMFLVWEETYSHWFHCRNFSPFQIHPGHT